MSSPTVTAANIAIIQCGKMISVVWKTAPVLATRSSEFSDSYGQRQVESLLHARNCILAGDAQLLRATGNTDRRSAKW